MSAGKTIAEKILSARSGQNAKAGDLVVAEVAFAMIHDINGPATVDFFNELDAEIGMERARIAFFLDHFAPCPTPNAANTHIKLRNFAKRHNLKVFDVGEGICHQLVIENGCILPGTVNVATDSHACSYGALNALGISIGATEMAVVLASGECWFKVPESIRVTLTGKMPPFVTSKDIALHLIKTVTESGAIYKCIEFTGDAIETMSVDSRIVICNLVVEMGAKAGIMPGDQRLADWFAQKGIESPQFVAADPDAGYCRELTIDVSTLAPQIAKSPVIDDVVDVSAMAGTKIDQVVIGSCTNGRYEDFKIVADILAGKKIADGVRLIIVPASRSILQQLVETGIMGILLSAGAIVNPPGCGPCAGLHGGLLGDGEVVLTTTNRNMKGRMGSNKADIHVCSPVIAAYAALAGEIVIP